MADVKCDSDVCNYKTKDGYCGKSRIELLCGMCQDEEYEEDDDE